MWDSLISGLVSYLFTVHSLYFWFSNCVLGMGLTGLMCKRKIVPRNLKFPFNRSMSWCVEVIYNTSKRVVFDVFTASLDFRVRGGSILLEYFA